jgi:lipid II:glycine glycyltransferase (peptidoglycan interpeptide bridge formation enzyme)
MTGTDDDVLRAFPRLCDALFRSERIVAEFAHLHPWSSARDVLDPEACFYNREIIWLDLDLSLDELWSSQFQHCCRKNIARAGREGVKVFAGSSDDHIREFLRIYTGTMQSRHALPHYHFPYGFFCDLRDELPENVRFVFAEHRNQIIAATLYLHDDSDVFSFLGGADSAFQLVRPTNAVIWDTVQWARRVGKRRLILGGGYRPDDGIFRFKATFSRLRQAFYIYSRIHLQQDYALLERQCCEYFRITRLPAGYFPSYRHTPQAI